MISILSMADLSEAASGEANDRVAIHSPENIKSSIISSASNSSSDTLNDDGSSDHRSNSNATNSYSSPLSPTDLTFENLTITDNTPRFPKGGSDRYTTPHLRDPKHYNDPNTYGPLSRDFGRRGITNRAGAPYGSRGAYAGFRNTRTWISPDMQAQQEYMIVRNAMRRQFKHSDVAKWKLADYIAHREAMVAAQASRLADQVEVKEQARNSRANTIPVETQLSLKKWGLEGNFEEFGNYGRVLGEQTIWCNDWINGKDEIAPWPSMPEMKWEGDDRAKTGVGRFLPLPREQGPPSLPWNQLPVVEQYPIDQIAKIPTMEDVYLPIDAQIEPENEYLWSKSLEEEMDIFLGS